MTVSSPWDLAPVPPAPSNLVLDSSSLAKDFVSNFSARTSWLSLLTRDPICSYSLLHFPPYLTTSVLWAPMLVVVLPSRHHLQELLLDFICIFYWSRMWLTLLCSLFICSIHFISNSAQYKFQDTIHWRNVVTMIPCGWDSCVFVRHNQMVPMKFNLNHVVLQGIHMWILLASHLPVAEGALEYQLVGHTGPTGLVGSSHPLCIAWTWSFLWMYILLFRPNFYGAFQTVLTNIVSHSLLMFLCMHTIFQY